MFSSVTHVYIHINILHVCPFVTEGYICVRCVFFCYSCVYKCVCKQFSERLYSDLVKLITDHLAKVAQDLQAPVSYNVLKL